MAATNAQDGQTPPGAAGEMACPHRPHFFILIFIGSTRCLFHTIWDRKVTDEMRLAMLPSRSVDQPVKSPVFTTTPWSMVLRARGDTPFAAECLERLCATYWFPLYAFLRHNGHPKERAEDLTQGFFHHLLSGDYLAGIHPSKGRFRNFLLASLKNFAANARDRDYAQKRGGASTILHLDAMDPEDRYKLELATDLSPDKLFHRRWALNVLDQAFNQLREQSDGKEAWFDAVKPLMVGDNLDVTYKELAVKLGASEGAVKVYVHRLRQRFAASIRQIIWCTVERPEQVEEEIRDLLLALQ